MLDLASIQLWKKNDFSVTCLTPERWHDLSCLTYSRDSTCLILTTVTWDLLETVLHVCDVLPPLQYSLLSLTCSCILTNPLEDNMEERHNRSINEAVQLVHKSLFDHLVSWNKHHPFAASPQAEHRTVLLSKLHFKTNWTDAHFDKDLYFSIYELHIGLK